MAISPQAFPSRKRRPSAASFISPKWTEINLVRSLLALCQEISTMNQLQVIRKRDSLSLIRKSEILAMFFDEILRNSNSAFSPLAILCFEEMYIVLQRMKTLIEDCCDGAKMWMLIQNGSLAHNFHELVLDLSNLLDILPVKEVIGFNEDIEDLFNLLTKQCFESELFVDPREEDLRHQVLKMLDQIKNEVAPDDSELLEIFFKLEIRDSSSCREEIENLEDEVQNQTDENCKCDLISLIGLVRYAKCVLFGSSSANPNRRRKKTTTSDLTLPADFKCPISLDLMRDPVVVATGQTYDRSSITMWIESGHKTCPKTGQFLAHTDLIPNTALKNLISMWCRQRRIPLDNGEKRQSVQISIKTNKTALEANKMTASFLINKLAVSESIESSNNVIYELRSLSKTDSISRACIAEAGAVPFLIPYLNSEHKNLQVNAVTAILNLSILQSNKTRIIETEGAVNGIIEVLISGSTWEAKGNAAATIFSLSSIHSYGRRLGRNTRVITGLIDLANDGPTNSKRDALVAILSLAGDKEIAWRLIEGGVMELIGNLLNRLPEEAVTVLEVVVRMGGIIAVVSACSLMRKLFVVLREGSDRAKEIAAATLVMICRKGGSETVAELAATPGVERVVWELMENGTMRGRRKAGSLLRILRRWAAGLLDGRVLDADSNTSVSSSIRRTATVVPS